MPGASAGELGEEREPFAAGEGFAGRVARAREAMLAHDPEPADLPDPSLRRLEIESLIGVPLLAENAVTGVLVVASVAPRRLSSEDLAMLRLAADRVALAIEHARVYEREHKIAVTLQQSLLPAKLPVVPGLEVAARYLPAATEADVGGDWYDVIPTPTGGLGLVMGDVAGKGLAAASMVSRLRSALRAYALEGHEPSRVIEQLNRLVWTEARDSQMATLLYMVVEPGESRVDWVNAGHPAPLHAGGDDAPHYLEGASSVPLGVLPFPSYETVTSAMEPGSSIVLFTDGLIERPGELIDDGMAQLAASVSEAPDDLEELCDHLLETLVPSSGATDDVAILMLRNLPVTDRVRAEFEAEPEALSHDARDAAALAAPRGRRRQRDRRDHDRLRGGRHERHRACGHGRRRALRGQRPDPGPRDRAHGARRRRMAPPARGRPGPRAVAHARADGYGGGVAVAAGNNSAIATKTRQSGRT